MAGNISGKPRAQAKNVQHSSVNVRSVPPNEINVKKDVYFVLP